MCAYLRVRALQDMMGGSLEQRKDYDQADDLGKPDFYGEEVSDYIFSSPRFQH